MKRTTNFNVAVQSIGVKGPANYTDPWSEGENLLLLLFICLFICLFPVSKHFIAEAVSHWLRLFIIQPQEFLHKVYCREIIQDPWELGNQNFPLLKHNKSQIYSLTLQTNSSINHFILLHCLGCWTKCHLI